MIILDVKIWIFKFLFIIIIPVFMVCGGAWVCGGLCLYLWAIAYMQVSHGVPGGQRTTCWVSYLLPPCGIHRLNLSSQIYKQAHQRADYFYRHQILKFKNNYLSVLQKLRKFSGNINIAIKLLCQRKNTIFFHMETWTNAFRWGWQVPNYLSTTPDPME